MTEVDPTVCANMLSVHILLKGFAKQKDRLGY